MGSKRRWSTQLCELLGVAAAKPDEVVLVDAGPWGDAWNVLQHAAERRSVATWLRTWGEQMDGAELWRHLVERAPLQLSLVSP
jgi:hypothetical protein